MLANTDTRRSSGAHRAILLLGEAKSMVGGTGTLKAYAVLHFASGILYNCGINEEALPWVFEPEKANALDEPNLFPVAKLA